MFRTLIPFLLSLVVWRADAQPAPARVRPPVKSPNCDSMPTVGRTIGELCTDGSTSELKYWNGVEWLVIGASSVSTGPSYVADFVIYDTDSTSAPRYKLINTKTGGLTSESNDAAEVINDGIQYVGDDGGTIVILPGTYIYTGDANSIPEFRANRTGWTRVIGERATIVLSSTARRAFGFSDDDIGGTFQFIELAGLTINADNIGDPFIAGVILGNWSEDTVTYTDHYMNGVAYDNIYIHDVDASAPTVTDNAGAMAIWFYYRALSAPGTPTPHTMTNMTFERIHLDGFTGAITLGLHEGPYIRPSNIAIDNVIIRDVEHKTRGEYWVWRPMTNFRLGGYGIVGKALLENLYGDYSGDNNLEVNNAYDLTIKNCSFKNAVVVNIYLTNFNEYVDYKKQLTRIESTVMEQSSPTEAIMSVANLVGFQIYGYETGAGPTYGYGTHYGKVIVTNSQFISSDTPRLSMAARAFANVEDVTIDNFKINYDIHQNAATYATAFWWGNDETLYPFRVSLSNISVVGDITADDTAINVSMGYFGGTDTEVNIKNFNVDLTFDGTTLTSGFIPFLRILELGIDGANKISGTIDGFRINRADGLPNWYTIYGILIDDYVAMDPAFRIQNSYFGLIPAYGQTIYSENPAIYNQISRAGNYPDTGNLRALEISQIPPAFSNNWEFFDDFCYQPGTNPYNHFDTGTEYAANTGQAYGAPARSTFCTSYIYTVDPANLGINITGQNTTNNNYGGIYFLPVYMNNFTARTKASTTAVNNMKILVGGVQTEDDGDISTKLRGAFFWCDQRADVDADGTPGDADSDSTCGEVAATPPEDADDCNWYAVVMDDTDSTSGDDASLGDNDYTTIENTGVVCYPSTTSNSDFNRFTIIPVPAAVEFKIDGVSVATVAEDVGGYLMPFVGVWSEILDTDDNGIVVDFIQLQGAQR